ncbi:MAG TPA: magnesium/cobalt transporter CorA [Leptospiraceae bacterium]|nr:magnesium/cobalt transporter CorA [Leptospiraceae bacterium]HNI95148.1 magnesium/cobalt transporter CorA [Leptospiraceae bacterium]
MLFQKRGSLMLGTSWILNTNGKTEIDSDEALPVFRVKTWIHLTPKNEEELTKLLKNYNIHPLTIEDLMNLHSRIKKEEFPNYTFVIFRGIHFDANIISAKNFNFIITKNVLITVALDHRNTINDIIENWQNGKDLLDRGLEFIIHRIMDAETDHLLPIVYRIEDQAEELEAKIFGSDRKLDIGTVFMLRGNLQQIKKIILQHIEILKEMETSEEDFISVESDAFFRDVKDHSYRILDITENVKEMISSALEVHLTVSSRKSNEIMTILTMMTAIMLPMSLIAGLYGMNFKYIPMLENPNGFFISIGIMGIIGILMALYFKLKKWF